MLEGLRPIVNVVASTTLPTRYGVFQMHVYVDDNGLEHVALVVGELAGSAPVLVRLHSECLTGDVFGSQRCDCGEQLQQSMSELQAAQRGVLLYLRQEGRGIGLVNKIRAYALQETQGLDTVDANRALGLPDDMREYSRAAAILADLGVDRVALMTNNPLKIQDLQQHGIVVVERCAAHVLPNVHNQPYLQAKRERMGHLF
ncbi:GTP cyclohydrolase II [Candidatus Chloroploca asiatica]|uniref:GTP cyclohydrolase-2 n=1 Tax=Candidatus Chloroploca asiatica TaxID=1506545 RepID=A0A2H3KNJ1_9CHLR|nr:GTP cyclohydrolase II [Candidatus Chloroploca asiatica]PDV96716.1 GTP cyclohydrolase II [Candidatus Chloroploca asiatica]